MHTKLFLGTTLLLGIVSCVSTKAVSEAQELARKRETPLLYIDKGSKKQEVIALLGAPHYRRFGLGDEEWEYHRAQAQVVILTFKDSLVWSMNAYRDSLTYAKNEELRLEREKNEAKAQEQRYELEKQRILERQRHEETQRQNTTVVVPVVIGQDDQRIRYTNFLDQLRRCPASQRLSFLEEQASQYRFTAEQTIELMRFFQSDRERLIVVAAVAPRLIDHENAHKIVNMISWLFRNQARELLGLPQELMDFPF